MTTVAPRSFALALGGGGARGLAHLAIIETLDELGVRPVAVAGASIGAAIGAAYAAGMRGRDIRRHLIALMHDRPESMRRLMAARVAPLSAMFAGGLANPMLMDAEKLCGLFLPDAVPDSFEELAIPLTVVTADLFAREERVFDAGPLKAPIAASMAIPGLIRPVEIDGRVLVDGAAVNPLPFDRLLGRADVLIAVDTGTGPTAPRGIPDPWDALLSTIQLMGQAIVAEKLRHGGPDLVIKPDVSAFRLLDFFRVSAILRVAERTKPEAKAALARLLGVPL